ncbi:hypothetical protein BJV82DRAFT_178113 [Fennellomyces sp. T-0311]|nr:hypothetical protein BJV82DRAFT_178113 [Fennellomyces sp. T-0311]
MLELTSAFNDLALLSFSSPGAIAWRGSKIVSQEINTFLSIAISIFLVILGVMILHATIATPFQPLNLFACCLN